MEVLDKPIRPIDETEVDSSAFREPLDLMLAFIDEDGELIAFHFDSGRFEPFPGGT